MSNVYVDFHLPNAKILFFYNSSLLAALKSWKIEGESWKQKRAEAVYEGGAEIDENANSNV